MKDREHQEQVALFVWSRQQQQKYPELAWMYAIPNVGGRAIGAEVKLKKEGRKKGVPDICLPVACKGFNSLYIELKIGKNKQTQDQYLWELALKKMGNKVEVCYGWKIARDVIIDYLS